MQTVLFQKINSGNPTVVASPDALTQSSVDSHPKKHDVTTTGDKVPAPFMSFESAGFPPEILIHIQAAGFALPTPIQAQTWPIALQNRDLVALSKTDSGKTLAYLIPALMLLRRCNNNHEHGPTVVVLSPTRELALQIQHEAIKFGRSVKISSLCLYSEGPKGPQLKDLERGADIVVATPGRLNEAIELRKLDFGQVSLLVLDETDKMLDMGFEPQIRKIVNEIPPRKQTLMYAATWRREVRNIAGDLLVNPVQVNIDNANELAANKSSSQDCKHASTDLTKVDGAANQPVPHNVREIATRGGGVRGRGGLRNDRFGGRGGFSGVGSGGPDGGRNRNDRLKDSCGRGQFDNRRDGDRRRGRSYSRSRSPSWSRSRSRTPVRRGRSRSRSYSCRRNWSPSPRRGRSRTRRPVRCERRSRSSDRSLSRSWSRGRSRSRSWSRTVRRERWRESK
ncbi:DEAD-box ATP-dependent RNA helicase 40-like [Bidens hawaiensis]|uniref:DEAD-box ATP-dependent RNA helicase 40-like n=1 Tax=Bidens hawaiensis TaxID=980011 RepID=UPI00404B31ED